MNKMLRNKISYIKFILILLFLVFYAQFIVWAEKSVSTNNNTQQKEIGFTTNNLITEASDNITDFPDNIPDIVEDITNIPENLKELFDNTMEFVQNNLSTDEKEIFINTFDNIKDEILYIIDGFTGQISEDLLICESPSDMAINFFRHEPNGCSVPSNIDFIDNIYNFTPACNRHDLCYKHGQATYAFTKNQCDITFLRYMCEICHYNYTETEKICITKAIVYYGAVALSPEASNAFIQVKNLVGSMELIMKNDAHGEGSNCYNYLCKNPNPCKCTAFPVHWIK